MVAGGFVGYSHRDANVSVASMGREGLLPVDNPIVTIQLGYGLCSGGVASRFGFREAPGAQFLAPGERENEFLPLFFVAEAVDMAGTQRIVRRHRYSDGAVHARQFLAVAELHKASRESDHGIDHCPGHIAIAAPVTLWA